MDAIFYVLRTGCKWKALPRSLGAASTVHDRFQEWCKAGVFEQMWRAGLLEYNEKVGIEWEWQAMGRSGRTSVWTKAMTTPRYGSWWRSGATRPTSAPVARKPRLRDAFPAIGRDVGSSSGRTPS
jgi:transposase